MPRGDAFKDLCYWRVLSCADRSGASTRGCLAAVLCWKGSTLVAVCACWDQLHASVPGQRLGGDSCCLWQCVCRG